MMSSMGALFRKAVSFTNDWSNPDPKLAGTASLSIVVPVYRPHNFPEFLQHLDAVAGDCEVILVDDSGDGNEAILGQVGNRERVTLLRHIVNLGRPAARNTGAVHATGDILVFLDQDMFISPNFLARVRALVTANDRAIVLGMRETRSVADIPGVDCWREPALTVDWRHGIRVGSGLVDLTAAGVGSATNQCQPLEWIDLCGESRDFRDLGIAPTSTRGYWDLASMVVSHSFAIDRHSFHKVGGFPEWIRGWGGEDIVLGFSAAAASIPIIPSGCVGYQAQHAPYSGSEASKFAELSKNLATYRSWAQAADEFEKVDAEIPELIAE
jgi:Glycosyl transferase family 2/N-terminal domain of galactosyltransferase